MKNNEKKLFSKYLKRDNAKAKDQGASSLLIDIKNSIDKKIDNLVHVDKDALEATSKKEDIDNLRVDIRGIKKAMPVIEKQNNSDVVESINKLSSDVKESSEKTVEVGKPKWFSLKSVETVLEDGFVGVITVLNKILSKKVNLDKYKKKENAIAVKLVKNNDMSFYEAGGGGSVLGSGSGSSSGSEVNVKNSGGTIINPSTEEKQDDIIAALGSTTSTPTRIVIEKDSVDTNIQYVGVAVSGSTTDQAVWKIQRLDETTVLDRTWAGGDDTQDKIYDDRESLIYS